MEIDFDSLLHAATYYLSYQRKIGREVMISESLLKFPVADYLTGAGTKIGQIELEFPHPKLVDRYIDLVKIKEGSNKELIFAIEFKIAKPATKDSSEKKRIFYDLMRLFLLTEKGTKGYFMIVGEFNHFISYFKSTPIAKDKAIKEKKEQNQKIPERKSFYNEWFNFAKDIPQVFKVDKAEKKSYQTFYDSFIEVYQPRMNHSHKLPEKLTTKCIAISKLNRGNPVPYIGGVWEILAT
jgi:hypothetical protein